MKRTTTQAIAHLFERLAQRYDLHVPICLPDGTRVLGRLDEGPLALRGPTILGKPLAVFFPQVETKFVYRNGQLHKPPTAEMPLLVAGLSPADLRCLAFVDRFFAEQYADDLYLGKRRSAIVIGISGYSGANGEFFPPAGGLCDLELVAEPDQFIACAYSAAGCELLEQLEGERVESLGQLAEATNEDFQQFEQTVRRAAELLQAGKVPESFWDQIAQRCIACTGCNLVCPTCTCFDVHDWKCGLASQRDRLWDSCQLEGFAREAGGFNPMPTEAHRTCRRIHHKLVADPRRWGVITCFFCGRCDQVCPTGIGIHAVCRQIVEQFG